jgi:hypothetical protein
VIQVEWANPEQTIVRWRFGWPWTWDEFYTALDQVNAMIDGISGIADSIILPSRSTILPANAISHLRRLINGRHPRHDLIVLVGSSSFVAELLKLSTQFIPSVRDQLHYVGTEEEALNLITVAQQRRERGKASHPA